MTAHHRFSTLAALGGLVAPLAMVALTTSPADAGASHSHKHEVYIYKVEKDLRLAGVGTDTVGDTTTPDLRCNGGDTVLDGMWMVKNVDQYNPPANDPDEDPDYPTTVGGDYNDARDVHVVASYPDSTDGAKWLFEFENRAYGDAQLKLYATCIRATTESARSHNHQIPVTTVGKLTSALTAHPTWSNRSYYEWSNPSFCASGQYFVAPGFKFPTSTTDHRLVASYPQSASNGLRWTWEFGGDSTLPTMNFYGKCIDRRVLVNGHRHALAMKHLPSPEILSGYGASIPPGDPREVRYSCDQDQSGLHGYKAAVGAFYMGNNWENHWFLGMEPRPKTRAFSFWNLGASNGEVKLATLCINSRTGNPIP